MTRAKDISKIVTDADLSGTLDVTGTVTAEDVAISSSVPILRFTDTDTNETATVQTSNAGHILLDASQGNASGSGGLYVRTQAQTLRALFGSNGDISFYEDTGTTAKLFWDASVQALTVNESTIISGGTPQTTPSIQASDGGTAGAGFGVVSSNNEIAGQLRIAASSQNAVYLEADPSNQRADSWLGFRVDASEKARIDSSGNVGIGTSSPAKTLHVATTGNATPYLHFTTDGTGHTASDGASVYLDRSTDGLNLSAYETNGTIVFRTNGAAERMRIDSSGNLLVGTTGSVGNGGKFQVKRTDNGACGYFETLNNAGGSQNVVDIVSATNAVFTPLRFWVNGYGATLGGSIGTSSSGTSYNTTSDHRLKENVTADWDATTRLKQLNPVRFNFIADADTTVDGFLAHEVQSVVPEAITGTHNEVDGDGNAVYQQIDQSKLVPLLVKTIQELEARIVALETA